MAERLYPVVYDFLVVNGYAKTAAKCLKDIAKTEAEMKTTESLTKMYKAYLEKSKASVPVVKAVGAKRKAEEAVSSSESDSESEESEPEKKVVVKKKTEIKKKVVDSSDESSEEESDDDEDSDEESSDEEDDDTATLARIKLKEEERKKKAIEASEAAAAWTQVNSSCLYSSISLASSSTMTSLKLFFNSVPSPASLYVPHTEKCETKRSPCEWRGI
jgi:hypothetical protein